MDIRIREFQAGDGPAFQRLNEEWIARYFELEPKDREALGDPEGRIISKGGRVFLAVSEPDGEAVGCCALVALEPGEQGKTAFEVAKMAVTERVQRTGIGRALLTYVVEAAREAGAGRLYLETNHALTPAIRLYESLGFRHLDPAKVKPSPYRRATVFMELLLTDEPAATRCSAL